MAACLGDGGASRKALAAFAIVRGVSLEPVVAVGTGAGLCSGCKERAKPDRESGAEGVLAAGAKGCDPDQSDDRL